MTSTATASRTARLDAVRRSPELANLHDEKGWLALYTADATVEDPVGTPVAQRGVFSRPGKDDLERFYATFIAPSRIEVEELGDFVVGDTVVRDVVLHVQLPGGGRPNVPAVLRYELVAEGGALRVKRLRAYWDAGANGREVLAQGVRGKLTSILSGIRLLRFLGKDWAGRYLEGTKKGIRRDGPVKTEALCRALASGDRNALSEVAIDGATIRLADSSPKKLADLDGKALGLALERATSSGYSVTARSRVNDGGRVLEGIGILEFDPSTKKVASVEVFFERG